MLMYNISHVKKYEQCPPSAKYLKAWGKRSKFLNLIFLVLICTTYNFYSISTLGEPPVKKELPLEISEKYYKKEAILKFNEAVSKWELKEVNTAVSLWNEAVSIDPTLWVAYLGLGQAYESQKEYTKALESYNQYLKLAPEAAKDKKSVTEALKNLSYLLRHGEEALKGEDYLSLVKTKHQGKEHYVRWDLSSPIKVYFYPAINVPNYKKEFENAFLEGAMIWQEVLADLKIETVDTSASGKLKGKKAKAKEKEIIDSAQIKVVFPSRFKIKGDPNNPIASQIDAQSFPIIRDKKNFRVLGVIMVSPYIYYQAQIAIPLEPLSKLKKEEQIQKVKITAAREFGHVLGLWGFSPNPDDLMFEGVIEGGRDLPLLSERDKNTIRKLYELSTENGEVITNK